MSGGFVNLVGELESGNNPNAALTGDMVDAQYQQYPAFVSQYGSGATGVQNFENQALAANPNLTVGDAYAEYALGSGSPGSGPTFQQLELQYPAAAANFNANAGVSADTPLSDLSTGTTADSLANQDFSGGSAYAPSTVPPADYGLMPEPTYGYPNGQIQNQYGIPESTSSSSTGNPNYFTDVIASVENWLQRGALIILGIVLLAGAAYALSNKDVNAALVRGVQAIPG